MRIKVLIALICLGLLSGTASIFADTPPVTFSGRFNDPSNTALVNTDPSGPDLSGSWLISPLFGDEWEIATNVAIYDLSIPVAGQVRFNSNGFEAGGADPYFTLFIGSGIGATFRGSNYTQAFSTGGDFDLLYDLAAGDYRVAMGVFANESFAENYGYGTLGDGFIGLISLTDEDGNYLPGNYYYELEVTGPVQTVPEPGTLLLTLLGLAGLAGLRRKSTS